MSFNFNIFGAVTGAIGLLGFFQLVNFIFQLHLPSRRLALLDAVLNDLHSLIQTAIEEGIMYNRDPPLISEAVISK